MSDDIKYEYGTATSTVSGINQLILQLRASTEKFDTISSLLTVSEGEEVTALKAYFMIEKVAVLKIADFYEALMKMILEAANEMNQTETSYGQEHITGGNS